MNSLFSSRKPVVGVIHVGALPGTPRSSQAVSELVESARDEARIYRECGVDGVIISLAAHGYTPGIITTAAEAVRPLFGL